MARSYILWKVDTTHRWQKQRGSYTLLNLMPLHRNVILQQRITLVYQSGPPYFQQLPLPVIPHVQEHIGCQLGCCGWHLKGQIHYLVDQATQITVPLFLLTFVLPNTSKLTHPLPIVNTINFLYILLTLVTTDDFLINFQLHFHYALVNTVIITLLL